MKITAVNGRPRGKNGNTFVMIEQVLKGAENKGAKTKHILLHNKKIHHCIGCFTCWFKTPGVCVFTDDMTNLLSSLDCDILIFATPLYVDNVTGIMKNFMDRLIPNVLPFFEKDEFGETVHKVEKNKIPKFVIVSNCGFPEQSHFQALSNLFKRVARNYQTQIIAEIYRGQGELLKNKNILLLPVLMRYKKLLRKAGEELATNMQLSHETISKLERPLIPNDIYFKEANKRFEKKLCKS
jgi:multimeric flavodoxin WrbA